MEIAIIYSSKTGNTKKIAEAIREGVGGNGSLFSVEDKISLEKFDFIFMGYWVDKGTADKKALYFMGNIENKKIALFATLGAYPNTQHATDSLEAGKTLLGENCEVVDSFICQGAIDPKLTEWMKTLPKEHPHGPDEARLKRWKDASSRPDSSDLQNAKEFAQNVIRNLQ